MDILGGITLCLVHRRVGAWEMVLLRVAECLVALRLPLGDDSPPPPSPVRTTTDVCRHRLLTPGGAYSP